MEVQDVKLHGASTDLVQQAAKVFSVLNVNSLRLVHMLLSDEDFS